MKISIVVIILMCWVMMKSIETQTIDDAENLTDTLFKNYRKRFRPIYNQSMAVKVQVEISMTSIHSFDAVTGILTFGAGLFINWHDYRLEWNPLDYGGISSVSVLREEIWYPKLYFISTAEDVRSIGRDDFPNRVLSNGMVIMSMGHQLRSVCNSDIRKFPKDVHTCNILLIPSDFVSEIVLSASTNTFVFINYTQNGEWNILQSYARSYIGYAGLYSEASFVMTLERKPSYLLIIMIIPMLMLGMLSPMVFLLPVESGERVSYTITIFLSFAIYMSLIGENLPNTTDPMPYLSYLLMALLSGSALITMATIFTLWLHNQASGRPRGLKRFLTLEFCSSCKVSCRRGKNVNNDKVMPFDQKQEDSNEFKLESERHTISEDISQGPIMEMLPKSRDRIDMILFRFFSVYMALSTILYLVSIYF